MILGALQTLLLVGVALVVIMALLAPLESLRWWAGWSDDDVAEAAPRAVEGPAPVAPPPSDACYLVWLSGIGSVPGKTEDPFEVRFLTELKQRVPSAVIIDDAFAYSVRENPLAGKEIQDRVWRTARAGDVKGLEKVMLGSLIQLRNTLQIAVSADGRYGPIYNLGLAEAVGKRLLARGYPAELAPPIILLGYSGGGQIAVGAARYLKGWFHAPVYIISIGGVIGDEPGIQSVEHLYQVRGSKDPIPMLSRVVFIGHWPFVWYSYWNRARTSGKVTFLAGGPAGHMAEAGYFGSPHIENTLSIVVPLIEEAAALPAHVA